MFRALISMGIVLMMLTQTLSCIPTVVAVGAYKAHKKRTKGKIKDASALDKITVGKTTKAEVRKQLGKPFKKVSGKDTEKLVYRFKKTKGKKGSDSGKSEAPGKFFVITLDKNKVVSHVERTDSW